MTPDDLVWWNPQQHGWYECDLVAHHNDGDGSIMGMGGTMIHIASQHDEDDDEDDGDDDDVDSSGCVCDQL